MNVDICTTWDELARLRPTWNSLAEDIPTRSWEWLSSWWKVYGHGRVLIVLVARDSAGSVRGLAPLYLEKRGPLPQLRFLGSGRVCSDYAAFLIEPGYESEIAGAFAHAVRETSGSLGRRLARASLRLEGVEAVSPWRDAWESAVGKLGYTTRCKPIESAWRLALPTSFEAVSKLVHSHVRRKLRKAAGRLDCGEVELRVIDPAEVSQYLVTLERLHTSRQRRKGQSGSYEDPRFAQFIQVAVPQLIENRKAHLAACFSADKCVSIQLHLLGAGGIWMYQSGIAPEAERLEPGHLMITATLKYGIENRYAFHDFMRGNEPYKAQWGAEARPLEDVTYVPPVLLPQLADTTHAWLREIRDWSKSALGSAKSTTLE